MQKVVISVLSTHREDVSCAGVGEFLFYLGELVDIDEKEITELDWSVSPNPTTENITITLPKDIDLIGLNLYNSVGTKISNLPLPAGKQITIPVDDLQNGLYYINFQTESELRSKSFMKVD